MSQFFASGGQSIGLSGLASLLPMNSQDRFPLGLTGWISLQSKGLSRVFSNTTVQKHQFFRAQISLQFNIYMHTHIFYVFMTYLYIYIYFQATQFIMTFSKLSQTSKFFFRCPASVNTVFLEQLTYFWPHWGSTAAQSFSSWSEQGLLFVMVLSFSLRWLLLLQSTGSRHTGFSSCRKWAQQSRLTGLAAPRHVEPPQVTDGTTSLLRQVDSYALDQPGKSLQCTYRTKSGIS